MSDMETTKRNLVNSIVSPLTTDEMKYIIDVLGECEKTLEYVRKNSLYWDQTDKFCSEIAQIHKGNAVGAAAKIQVKVRGTLHKLRSRLVP